MSWRVVQGDCVELMAALEPATVDAIVCDPPYVAIAEARIGWWAEQPPAANTKAILKPPRKRAPASGSESLF